MLDNADLRACGLSRRRGHRRAPRRGILHLIYPGVYALGPRRALAQRGRFLAAVKACGRGAALSHRSAGGHARELLDWDERLVARTSSCRTSHTPHDPRHHRPSHPPPVPQIIRFDRIPVTTPARALIDLSSMLPFDPLRRAVREGTGAQARHAQGARRRERRQLRRDPRRRLRPHPQRVRGRGARPRRGRRLRSGPTSASWSIIGGKRIKPDFRWPEQRLIHRGRRRAVARPSARPRGRRRAPGAARSRG